MMKSRALSPARRLRTLLNFGYVAKSSIDQIEALGYRLKVINVELDGSLRVSFEGSSK
jgi:hypothetical protein